MEKKALTIRQAIRIGAIVGFLPVFYLLLILLLNGGFQRFPSESLFLMFVGLGVVLFGAIGAITGYVIRKTTAAITISAIIGTIIGSFGGLVLIATTLGLG